MRFDNELRGGAREEEVGDTKTKLLNTEAQHVKVVIKNYDKLPKWSPYTGNTT